MAEAMAAAGRDPRGLGPDPEALARVGVFVELHVEQGRGLVDLHEPVAVGSDIWPHGRWRLDFPGQANHAGTTALQDRQDAMLGYARAVLSARDAAERRGCLATIAKVAVQPGGVNAIPSAVTGWLDARGAHEDAVRGAVAEVAAEAREAGATVTEESWTPTTAFDPALVARLQRRLGGIPTLGTGAGHDAGILANAGIPAAMLFVRNPTGISHSPEEWAEADDCLAGVTALAAVLEDLAGETA
jgi:N-carbamoyl-L-amino-acid hydrolase